MIQQRTSPQIILGGDFNFPDKTWEDGNGYLQPSPTYGTTTNQLLMGRAKSWNRMKRNGTHAKLKNCICRLYTVLVLYTYKIFVTC